MVNAKLILIQNINVKRHVDFVTKIVAKNVNLLIMGELMMGRVQSSLQVMCVKILNRTVSKIFEIGICVQITKKEQFVLNLVANADANPLLVQIMKLLQIVRRIKEKGDVNPMT